MVVANDAMQKKLNTLKALTDKKMKSQFYEDNPDVIDFYKQKDDYDRYKRKAMGYPLYDKYPTPKPEVQKVMDFYNNLPKGDGPAKKDGTASSPKRSAWIKAHPNEWGAMTDYYNIKSQYDLAQAGANAVYEGEGFNEDDYKDILSLARSSGGSGGSGGFTPYKKNKPGFDSNGNLSIGSQYKYNLSSSVGGKAPAAAKAPRNSAKLGKVQLKSVAIGKPKVSIKKSRV